jgi:site-specific DNA-methyltransferase (adenine-specific)
MSTDYYDWAFDYGRWTKIAAQHTPDRNADPNELDEANNHGDDDKDEGPLWVIDVLADGKFSVFESHHSLTDREEPFDTFAEAVQYCEQRDGLLQHVRSQKKFPRQAIPDSKDPHLQTAEKKPVVAPASAVPVSGPGVTLSAYYSDDNCTIYNADCRDILPSLDRFDLLLTKPPQYELGLSDDNKSRMDSGSRLAPQTNRISPLPEAELLMAISKAANAIVWSPSRYRLLEGKLLEWCCRKVHIATAWHNIAVPRMMNWGDVPNSDRTRLLIQCIHIAPTANTILDPFMGTGDVLIAASRLRRRFVGIEIDKERCDQAVNRLLQLKKPR